MASYKDFKCRKCLDSGKHGIPCPSEEIGCAVYHWKFCDCEAGKNKMEESKNKTPMTPYQAPLFSNNLDINMTYPFSTYTSDSKLV